MKVICISAKARSGKDASATILKEIFEARGQRVLITHFADLVKHVCKAFFNWNGEKDGAGRTLLQYVGTDKISSRQPDFWVNFIVDILKFFEGEWDIVLIPDCRYPAEAEVMKASFDTTLLRIERPGFINGLSAVQQAHPSEIALDNYTYDATIINNGTLDDLAVKLHEFADSI